MQKMEVIESIFFQPIALKHVYYISLSLLL
jgi:hypothetical protein